MSSYCWVDREGRNITDEMEAKQAGVRRLRLQYDACVGLENKAYDHGTRAEYAYRMEASGRAYNGWVQADNAEREWATGLGALSLSVARSSEGHAISVREEPYE